MTSVKRKLWSLNLALLLVLVLVLPVGAQTELLTDGTRDQGWEVHHKDKEMFQSIGEVNLMEDDTPYLISVNGISFYSNTDSNGIGWHYDSQYGDLYLENYNGGPIRASGDLYVYADGDNTVKGVDSTNYGGSAITVDGYLGLYVWSGTLRVTGGSGTKGGHGITAWAMSLHSYGDAVELTGGRASGAREFGGYGIFVDAIYVYGSNITSSGGYSAQYAGGCGISAWSANIYADCTLNAGGGAITGTGLFLASDGYLSYNFIDIYGDPAIVLGENSSTGEVAVCELSEHAVKTENSEKTHVHVEPTKYRFLILGNGGVLPNGATFTSLVNYYSTAYYMDQYLFTRQGHAQVGWMGYGNLYPLNQGLVPSGNVYISAEWVEANPGDIILNALDYYFTDNSVYQRTCGETVTLSSFFESEDVLIGWNDTLSTEIRDDYSISGVWYEGGTELAPNPNDATVLYAQYVKTGQYVAYHTTNGTAANGGNMLIYGTPVSYSNLSVYVPEDDCVAAPEGYELLGWSTEPDGEVEYQAGDAVKLTPKTVVNLYAVWGKTSFSVTLPNTMTATIEKGSPVLEVSGQTDAAYTAMALYDTHGKLLLLDYAKVENGTLYMSISVEGIKADQIGSMEFFTLNEDQVPTDQSLAIAAEPELMDRLTQIMPLG